MKKIFFFFCFFLAILTVKADTMKHFELLNGKLSIPFDSTINKYTVYLIDGETNINANYILKDEKYYVDIKEDDELAIYTVMNKEEKLEEYYFYKNLKNDTVPIFNETTKEEIKEIHNLHIYILGICSLIILIIFKIVVIGFKKHKI